MIDVSRTALTVHGFSPDSPLSPFFGKARYVLVVDSDDNPLSFTRNRTWTSNWVCSAIAEADVERLICGFIDDESLHQLQESSNDVRVGPCSRPAINLIWDFVELPCACGTRSSEVHLYVAQDNTAE